MKSTTYTRFCRRLFSNIFERFNMRETTRNRLLEKADISMVYKEYYAMVFMNIILSFIIAFTATLILYILFQNNITAMLLLLLSSLIPVMVGMYYIQLPTSRAKSRGKNIDRRSAYAINFVNTMSAAGISPAEIFGTLATVEFYGEIQKEAKKISTEITMMGIDTITALKNAIIICPSQKFKEFLQGMLDVIQSGSELGPYFNRCVEKYMTDDLFERKRNLESLAVMAESFVVTVIAFPLFLVIIMSVMGMTGGGVSFTFMFVLAFLILPMAYFGFYVMMKSGMGEIE